MPLCTRGPARRPWACPVCRQRLDRKPSHVRLAATSGRGRGRLVIVHTAHPQISMSRSFWFHGRGQIIICRALYGTHCPGHLPRDHLCMALRMLRSARFGACQVHHYGSAPAPPACAARAPRPIPRSCAGTVGRPHTYGYRPAVPGRLASPSKPYLGGGTPP